MEYQQILKEIEQELDFTSKHGKVADYIPELARVEPSKFGMHLSCLSGEAVSLGNRDEKFSVQSIAKVFGLALAMKQVGEKIWKRINVEPSGNAFNSLMQLEYEEGIPRNPLINAGAIVLADILVTHLKDPKGEFLGFVRQMADSQKIDYNYAVADSEEKTGYRNRALAYMLRSFGNIENEVEEVLDFYFHLCSVEMTCRELARAFLVFANEGKLPGSPEKMITRLQSQRINALMQTCGFYDEAGDFAFLVGLPGKSGVGGGIAAVHPGQYSVAVWSPRLNEKGNSVLGMKALELLTSKSGKSIF